MGLNRLMADAERHRSFAALAALITSFGAVALVLDRPKGAIETWIALPLFAVGGALFAWVIWPSSTQATVQEPTLAARLIRFLAFRGRVTRAFPCVGLAIFVGDIGYNFLVSATPGFLTEDVFVMLLAAALLGYGFVPPAYALERDFILLFFIALNAILVLPLLALRVYYRNFDTSVDAYSSVALAPEVGAVLSLIGVPNVVHAVSGATAPGITFMPQHLGLEVTLVITTACSGIYSFGIFAAAFFAFVLTEYRKPSPLMWGFLGLGLVAAYVANILRMVVIVLVGYYTDTAATDLQNMLVAHSYAGWAIFLAWTALFWGLLFRLFTARGGSRGGATKSLAPRREAHCVVCGDGLTPAVAASRCECGAIYHLACHPESQPCPVCGRSKGVASTASPRNGPEAS